MGASLFKVIVIPLNNSCLRSHLQISFHLKQKILSWFLLLKPGFHIIVRVPATVCDYLRRSPAVSRLTCFHIAVRNRKESGTICNSNSVWRNIRKSEWWILYLKFVGKFTPFDWAVMSM